MPSFNCFSLRALVPAALLCVAFTCVATEQTDTPVPSLDRVAKERSALRGIWWRQTDKLLQALFDLRASQGVHPTKVYDEIRGLSYDGDDHASLQTSDQLVHHIRVKLSFLEQLFISKKGMDQRSAKALISQGLAEYVYEGAGLRLSLPSINPLLGRWRWTLGGATGISETYEFLPSGKRTTQTNRALIESVYTILEINDGSSRNYLLLDTGVKHEGEGYFRDPNLIEGEITTRLFINVLDKDAFVACEDLKGTNCYGKTFRIDSIGSAGTPVAKLPNPSIERTSPGKPGAASHVQR